MCSGAVPFSSTNPSQPWTQKSPQTGALGCPAQASEDELAKNKSFFQTVPSYLTCRRKPSPVAQQWECPGDPLPLAPACPQHPARLWGTQAPPSPAPAAPSSLSERCSLSSPFCWLAAHSRSPRMTTFVILSHPHCCCSTAGPAVSITNAPVSSLHTT